MKRLASSVYRHWNKARTTALLREGKPNCAACASTTTTTTTTRLLSRSSAGASSSFAHHTGSGRLHGKPVPLHQRLGRACARGSRGPISGTAGNGAVLGGGKMKTTSASASTAGDNSGYCDACGTPTIVAIPEGDNRERRVCPNCGKIHYVNPKVVVGCLVDRPSDEEGGVPQVLLCRRAIDPCKGLWTIPAGFQECGESTSEGAARETLEEANAEVKVLGPYAHLDIPAISQTYVIFRARFAEPAAGDPAPLHSAGQETLETRLFALDEVPYDEIAFSSVKIILDLFSRDLREGQWSFHHGTIVKEMGVAANSPQFSLTNYMRLKSDHKL